MATKLNSARPPRVPAIVGLAVAVALLSLPHAANADDLNNVNARRTYQPSPPIKDCTPINSRFGYYGNPWCTEAEQQRWDRWVARREISSEKR